MNIIFIFHEYYLTPVEYSKLLFYEKKKFVSHFLNRSVWFSDESQLPVGRKRSTLADGQTELEATSEKTF